MLPELVSAGVDISVEVRLFVYLSPGQKVAPNLLFRQLPRPQPPKADTLLRVLKAEFAERQRATTAGAEGSALAVKTRSVATEPGRTRATALRGRGSSCLCLFLRLRWWLSLGL